MSEKLVVLQNNYLVVPCSAPELIEVCQQGPLGPIGATGPTGPAGPTSTCS